MASDKTNVMRVLEQHKITYTAHEYPHGKEAVDGVTVAELLGQNIEQVFKTLVARGRSGSYHVFVIPVAKELDLKKSCQGRRGEVGGNGACQGAAGPDRLCARRLLAGRHEKSVCDGV